MKPKLRIGEEGNNKGVFQGNRQTKNGLIQPIFRTAWNLATSAFTKQHPHTREKARRQRQIDKGMLKGDYIK